MLARLQRVMEHLKLLQHLEVAPDSADACRSRQGCRKSDMAPPPGQGKFPLNPMNQHGSLHCDLWIFCNDLVVREVDAFAQLLLPQH